MYLNACASILLASLFAFSNAPEVLAKDVSNPILDYISLLGLRDQSEVYVIKAEIGMMNTEEVLISDSDSVNGKAGNIWTVYNISNGSFSKLDEFVTARRDMISVGFDRKEHRNIMYTYHPGNVEEGALIGYYIDIREVKEIDYGIFKPGEADKALFGNLFTDRAMLHPLSSTVREIKERSGSSKALLAQVQFGYNLGDTQNNNLSNHNQNSSPLKSNLTVLDFKESIQSESHKANHQKNAFIVMITTCLLLIGSTILIWRLRNK